MTEGYVQSTAFTQHSTAQQPAHWPYCIISKGGNICCVHMLWSGYAHLICGSMQGDSQLGRAVLHKVAQLRHQTNRGNCHLHYITFWLLSGFTTACIATALKEILSCCAVLCCAVLCCAVLCCAAQCCDIVGITCTGKDLPCWCQHLQVACCTTLLASG